MLSKIYAWLQANPAAVSWLVTVASAAVAHFGLKMTLANQAILVTAVMSFMHIWLNGKAQAPPAPPAK